jgi:sulfatase maturation enzyme AslB (radical SAM superfamily)
LLKEWLPTLIQSAIYREWLFHRIKRKQIPRVVMIEVTNACNLNCVMCPTQRRDIKRHNPDVFISLTLFKRLVDEIACLAPDTDVWLHKDGEPLLHPQILEMIEYSSSKLTNVRLSTNGTLLTDRISRRLLTSGLKSVRVSLDGISKETYERVRKQLPDNPYAHSENPVGYDRVMENLGNLCRLKGEIKSKVDIGVRITKFETTEPEIEGFKRYWAERVDTVEVADFLSWSGTIYKRQSTNRLPCLYLWTYAVIAATGRLVLCTSFIDLNGSKDGELADLRQMSISEAWYSSKMNSLRRAHLNQDLNEIAPSVGRARIGK